MELQVGKNSYITLEEAKQYIEDYVYVNAITEWVESLDDNYISKIINRSTNIIDKLYFKGTKVDSEQPLSFPRYDYKDRKKVVIDTPEDVKIAIVLQAVYESYFDNIYQDEKHMKKAGVNSYSVDGASISFNKDISDEKLSNGIYKDIFEDYLRIYTVFI